MKSDLYKKVESIFRNSTLQDELFDAFAESIDKIKDLDLYKILLANPFLSADEIKMYTEKLLREIPDQLYTICLWTAGVFESRSYDLANYNSIIHYYELAISHKPEEFEPFLSLLKLYNYDVETGYNGRLLNIIEGGLEKVTIKSRVYYALSDLYKKLNIPQKAARYLALAEKSIELER